MNKKLVYFGLAVAAVLILVILIQSVKIGHLRKTNAMQAVELMNLNDTAKQCRTKIGELYFKINAESVETEYLKSTLANTGFDLKRLKEREIDYKEIIAALRGQLAVKGRADSILLKDTVMVTTIGLPLPLTIKKFDWTNRYLSLSGLIKDKVMELDYSYKTDISFVTTKTGKSVMVTGYLSDPNARIVTGAQLVVTNPLHWWEKPWVWGVAGIMTGYFLAK